MRPDLFANIITFDEALAHVLEAATPIDRTEVVGLSDADGRVAARDVTAPADVPSFDRAAMDGYAVVAADTTGASAIAPRSLHLTGGVFTGETATRPLSRGECIEMATGAPIPPGADAVVMVEQTARRGDSVDVGVAVAAGQHIVRRGADIDAGTTVIRTGDVLTPGRVGALAAVGADTVAVFTRPSVAILVTGDEITEPGEMLPAGHVYNINRFTIESVIRRHGGVAVSLGHVGDTPDAVLRALDAGLAHDVVVFSGGSSVGTRDLLGAAIESRGDVAFHGIAIKPGKPTLFGKVGGTPIFGMPGNPTSCLTNAYVLLVPFLRVVARLAPWRPERRTVPLASDIRSPAGKLQFYPVRIVSARAEPVFKASGDITSLANADGFIEVAANVTEVLAGTAVTVTLV